ncbi:MAG: ERF family protein, partial [Solimonas sp.]
MSAGTETLVPQQALVAQQGGAPVRATPFDLLRIVVEQNAPLDKIKEMMDLQDRWEANQARKAFHAAMAKFREQHIRVLRSETVEQGPLRGTAYAKLSDFVGAAGQALSAAGLSVTWKILRDEEKWIEVACIVSHIDGHSEQRSMGGPPDAGGAKNAIQARASTVSYLEKYTFKMALGLAEENDDNDGNGNGWPKAEAPTRAEPPPREPESKPPFSAEG